MTRPTCILYLIVALALVAAPGHAQSTALPELRPRYSTLFAVPRMARDSVARPTHWKTGALVGGVALGGLGLVTAWALTGDTDSYSGDNRALSIIGATLVSAMLGATIGMLIGGLFPKQ
ncbi:MAG TPA: hypothetical protein VFY20_04750 [Gemmatimonadales bacterium]|nr:hypothetical protein [Gemmatimonadales bacterium]